MLFISSKIHLNATDVNLSRYINGRHAFDVHRVCSHSRCPNPVQELQRQGWAGHDPPDRSHAGALFLNGYLHALPASLGQRMQRYSLVSHHHGLTSNRAVQLGILRSHQTAEANSVTVGSQVYKGPSSPSRLHSLIFSFSFPRLACTGFPPLGVETKITMASPSDTIIIADDEELPILESGSSRPRRAPRRDYSYPNFENMIVESVDEEADTTLSRKRRRTKTKEPSALVPVPHETLFILN